MKRIPANFQRSIFRNVLSAISVLAIFIQITSAQVSVNSSGSTARGNGGEVSYSVGQVFYQCISVENATVSQGVQQPFEIYELTGIPYLEGISLTITAYPNPASDFLILKIDDFSSFGSLNM